MKIIRRNAIISAAVTPVEALSLAQIPAPPVAPTLATAKVKRTNTDDQVNGEALAGKLADLIARHDVAYPAFTAAKVAVDLCEVKRGPRYDGLATILRECNDELGKVDRSIAKLGGQARSIGSGDPDVAQMFRSAQDSQRGKGDNASEVWGAAFIGGWVAKRSAHDPSQAPKLYRLVVEIVGEETRYASYATSVAAEWAGVRWLTLKTDAPEQMTVRVETLDPATIGVKGEKPQPIASLSYVLTPDAARAKMATIIRRANLSGAYHEKKTRGSLGNRMRVKNYVATFSGG